MGWDTAGVSVRARAWFVLSSRELAGRLWQFQATSLPARAHFVVRIGRSEPVLLPHCADAGAAPGTHVGLVDLYHRRDYDADLLRAHGAFSEHALVVCLAGLEPDCRRNFNTRRNLWEWPCRQPSTFNP